MNRRVFLLVATLMVAVTAWSQLLWKVEGNGVSKPSYLMGTHHIAPASFIDSIKGLNEAINACDAVYGELHRDVMNDFASQQRLALALIAPADSTLDKVFTPQEYATVQRIADGYLAPLGINLKSLNMLKPIGVDLQLQSLRSMKYFKDYDPTNQIDRGVQNRGEQADKELGAFETLDDQINTIVSSPIADQAKTLLEACELDSLMEKMTIELADAYIHQEIDYLLTAIENPQYGSKPTDEELDRILWSRNQRWAEKLATLMPQQSILVCVGAGHLPGSKGLIALLRNAGYTVTPVSK